MEQEVERPVKGPLTRRRSGAVSTPERVLRSRTDKSDGSPPATPATALQEGTPSRGGTPKREGTPKKTLKQPADNVTGTPKRRSVRASSAQPEDSPAKRVLTRRRSTSLQPETPKKEDKTITTRSKLSTVASEKTVTPVLTRSRRSVAPSTSTSSEPSSKPSPEPVKEIKRITRRSASNSPAREIAAKAAGVKTTRRSSLLKSTNTSPVGSPDPDTSSDKTPSLIPRKRHVRNLGLSPVEENKNETAVPDSSNTDVKPDDITDPKSSQNTTTVAHTNSPEFIPDQVVGQIKVEQVSPVQKLNVHSLDIFVKSEVSSPNGSTSHDKNDSCAESEDSGIKEMEEFNSLENKGLDKIADIITDQVDIGSEVYEDQNNDPNSKLIQITMEAKEKTVKGLDKKNSRSKDDPSKLKTLDTNSSRLTNLEPVVSLVRLKADNIHEISQLINETENKKSLGCLDKTKPIGSNLEEKVSPVTQFEKKNTSELVIGEGLPDNKTLSKVTPLIKITSTLRNQNSLNDSITDQLLSEIIKEDAAKVEKLPKNTSENFEENKLEVIKEQGESAELQINTDDISVKEKSEHVDKTTASEAAGNEDLDFTLKIDTETEDGKSSTDDSMEENKSKSVQGVFSKSKEDNLNVPISKKFELENKNTEIDLSLTTEAVGVKESTSSNMEMGNENFSGDKTELSVAPLSPTSKLKSEDTIEVSPDLSSLSKRDYVKKSPIKDLKCDHSGETGISIQIAEASDTLVEDTLNDSQVDINYSLVANVSYDSVTDKKEDPISRDDLVKMDLTTGNTVSVSSESKTTDEEKDVNHSVIGDKEKDDAPEHLDVSLVSDDSFIEPKDNSAKDKSPKPRRSYRESDKKDNRKRVGDKEESETRMKQSAKLDISADESKVSEEKSDKKDLPYHPDCSMISVESFAEEKLIPTDSLVKDKDQTQPPEEIAIVEESNQTLIPDKSADQEMIKRPDEHETLLERPDNSVSAESSYKATKKDASERVSDKDCSTSKAEMSRAFDKIQVEKEYNVQSVEQSISLSHSSGVREKTIVENKSDDKLADQPINLIESSTISNETINENKSKDKPIDQSMNLLESSAISDETIVENKSDDKPADQSIDLSESSAISDEISVENKSEDKPVDRSNNLSESSGISDEIIVENKSDNKPVNQSIDLSEISAISDETRVGNKSEDKPIDQSMNLLESSAISDEIAVENKSDDKPVDQSINLSESSTISDETIVENKSDDKPVDQSIDLSESSAISDEITVQNKSEDKPVDQSINLSENSGISDEIIVKNKSDYKPMDHSVTQTGSSAISDETIVENKSEDKLADQSIHLSETSAISKETIVQNKSDDKPVDQSINLSESSGIPNKTVVENISDEKSVEKTIGLSESSSISEDTIVANKSDDKPVDQSITQTESSAISDETTVKNKSDEKSLIDIMDCTTQAETSDTFKETSSGKISEKSAINSSIGEAETSSASDVSFFHKSTSSQATNQVNTLSICDETKAEEKSVSDDLEIVDVEISGDGSDNDESKSEVVDKDVFSICDETLVQNKSIDDFDNLTSQADASSVCDETVVLVDADEKSVSEALECSTSQVDISGIETTVDNKSAENLNQSSSQFDSSSVCDKSITPGDSSTDTLEYPTTQADISGTSDETMSRGKSAGDALDHSTDDTSVKDQTDTSGVYEQQPTDKKTSDDGSKDPTLDEKSESASKVEHKSSDEVGNIILSLDDSTNESQDPFIEGAHADQSDIEKLNATVTLSDSEPEEVVFVKSSSESDDSEQIVTRGKNTSKKETGNNQKRSLLKGFINECPVEEECSSESCSSAREEEVSKLSLLIRTRDFIDDEAEARRETISSDSSSIKYPELLHNQQKKGIPKKKRKFVVNDESSETQCSSEDLSHQTKKKSRLSCFGHSKDLNVGVSKKSNDPLVSDTDKKDKKITSKKETKSSVQKISNVRKITPSSRRNEFEVTDSNNEIVKMDRDSLNNIEFRVRRCSDSYLSHCLANNINNSHATGGVFIVENQTDYCTGLKELNRRIKKKISCNINFKVEKYPIKSSESFAEKPYFSGTQFKVFQERIHQFKSPSDRMTVLTKNNESLDSMGKLNKGKECSTLSSRLMDTDNFNWNNNSEEAKAKKSKRRKFDETLQPEDLHSITLHDSSSELECSRTKPEVNTYQLLMEQPFSQPKIKCLKPCYSATIQNLGTGINALDLISLFTKLGIRGIEDIDLSTCPPRLFCKKLGYGNIRFSNEEAMQQCVDISRKVKLRGEELWMRACYCYKPLTRKASQWLSQSNTQFSEKKLKNMRKQKKTAQT